MAESRLRHPIRAAEREAEHLREVVEEGESAATPAILIGTWLVVAVVLVASVVNILLGSSPLGWAIALIGVIVFTVYTAYDVQKISYGDYAAALGSMEKASVFGAVHLYVDFINIFLFLLRIFGRRD